MCAVCPFDCEIVKVIDDLEFSSAAPDSVHSEPEHRESFESLDRRWTACRTGSYRRGHSGQSSKAGNRYDCDRFQRQRRDGREAQGGFSNKVHSADRTGRCGPRVIHLYQTWFWEGTFAPSGARRLLDDWIFRAASGLLIRPLLLSESL